VPAHFQHGRIDGEAGGGARHGFARQGLRKPVGYGIVGCGGAATWMSPKRWTRFPRRALLVAAFDASR
jgi:hypothetical protein